MGSVDCGSMVYRKISEILKLGTDVPDFQRLVDAQRVESIFNDIKNNRDKIILPGCLIFAKTNRKYWIIDGQHRFQVYIKLLKELKLDLSVYCNEIDVKNIEEANFLFNRVNDTRPLPVMPEGYNINIVKLIVDHFQKKYKLIFSNSQSGKCNRPNIHFTTLQEKIGEVHKNHPSLSEQNIIDWIEDFNEKFLTDDNLKKEYDFIKYKDDACKKGGFYLGIIPNYKWLNFIFGNIVEEKRQTISQTLRTEVWKKYNGRKWKGKCYTCPRKLEYDNFHCGHDIAVSKGGKTTLDNLFPICAPCNNKMGTMRIKELQEINECISK